MRSQSIPAKAKLLLTLLLLVAGKFSYGQVYGNTIKYLTPGPENSIQKAVQFSSVADTKSLTLGKFLFVHCPNGDCTIPYAAGTPGLIAIFSPIDGSTKPTLVAVNHHNEFDYYELSKDGKSYKFTSPDLTFMGWDKSFYTISFADFFKK